ncbi:MAG: hypothetical protein WBA72_10635 [Ornithinimicrobium sp.]
MSDTTTTPTTETAFSTPTPGPPPSAATAAATPSGDDAATNDDPRGGDDVTEDRGTAREAARYRRRLRETEAERDTLAERVERMQRAEVERIAGQHLAVGADLFTIGSATLAEMLDEAGNVAPDQVKTAAAKVAQARPGLAPRWPDMGAGKRGVPLSAGTSWGEVLKGSRE